MRNAEFGIIKGSAGWCGHRPVDFYYNTQSAIYFLPANWYNIEVLQKAMFHVKQ